jgi:hypothetical protein
MGVRASIFEFQVICFDGGVVSDIFDVQAVVSGCCSLLRLGEVI